jgi:hypothetical protein
VVYSICGEISDEVKHISTQFINRNEMVGATARLIDSKIYANYSIFTVNKIAYDLLFTTEKYAGEYSLMEKLDFEKYLEQQIGKIELPVKDVDFLKLKLLEMYANPLINAESIA